MTLLDNILKLDHASLVQKLGRSLRVQPEVAEDAVQDAYVVALRRSEPLDSLEAFVYTVARRVVFKEMRKATEALPEQLEDSGVAGLPSEETLEILEGMSSEMRRYLGLIMAGFGQTDAASAVGWSTRTAQRRLAALRAKLRGEE